jgi:hypothetical protein
MSQNLDEETQYHEYECTTTESDSSQSKVHVCKIAVYLDYILFNENMVLDEATKRESQPSSNCHWSHMVCKSPPAPWEVDLKSMTWLQFQSGAIKYLGSEFNFIKKMLIKVNNDQLVHWFGVISGWRTYGLKKGYEVTNENSFRNFVDAAYERTQETPEVGG